MAREQRVAIRTNVGEVEIAEHDVLDAAASMLREGRRHRCLVFLVASGSRNFDGVQRQSEALRLLVQQRAAHAVHADAVEIAGDGGEQRLDLPHLLDLVEREAAVLAAAPRDKYGWCFQGW